MTILLLSLFLILIHHIHFESQIPQPHPQNRAILPDSLLHVGRLLILEDGAEIRIAHHTVDGVFTAVRQLLPVRNVPLAALQ